MKKTKALLENIIALAIIVLFNTSAAPAYAQNGDKKPSVNPTTAIQPVKFEHFTIEEGLASNQTYQVLQSQQGFMWIATRQGLSKVDGSEFTNYPHDLENPNSIASIYLWTMRETPNGALWLRLFGGGLDRFDPAPETFTHYRHEEGNSNSLSTDILNSSFQDSRGIIWVATDKDLDRLDPQTNNITYYQPNLNTIDGLSAPVYMMLEDAQGLLWLGTYIGLNKFDSAPETFTHYQPVSGNPTSLSGSTVTFLGEDEPGVLWVGTMDGGLNRFDVQSSHFERFQHDSADPDSLSNNTVWWVIKDNSGAYWIATENGLNRYAPLSYRFSLYQYNPVNPNTLRNNVVQDFYEDEMLWISTAGGGLNKFDRAHGTFP